MLPSLFTSSSTNASHSSIYCYLSCARTHASLRVKARTEHPTKVMGAGGLRILSMLLSKGAELPAKEEGFEVDAEARNEQELAVALEAYAQES